MASNILIYEENYTIRKGIRYELEDAGYTVTACRNFKEVTEKIKTDFDWFVICTDRYDLNEVNLSNNVFEKLKLINSTNIIFLRISNDDTLLKKFPNSFSLSKSNINIGLELLTIISQ